MKYTVSNEKVNAVLDELSDEYKNLLLEKALSAHEEVDVDNINITTLVSFDERAKQTLVEDKKTQKRKQMSKLFSLMGLVYGMMGIMLLLSHLSLKTDGVDYLTVISATIALLGYIISLLPAVLNNKRTYIERSVEGNEKALGYQIVNNWKQIEGLLYQLTPGEKNTDVNSMTKYLSSLKLLSEKDSNIIFQLLKLRNEVVHDPKCNLSITGNEAKALFRDSSAIICKLKKFAEK